MKNLSCSSKKKFFAVNVLLTILIIIMLATCFVGVSYQNNIGLSLAVSAGTSIKDLSEELKTKELWDEDSESFNFDVLNSWIDVLFEDEDPIEYIQKVSDKFPLPDNTYSYVVKSANVLNKKAKDEQEGLILTLDGKEWMITSLTTATDEYGEEQVVATLYLKNPTRSTQYNSYSANTRGSNIYASSEIRNNVVLNKDGDFSLFNLPANEADQEDSFAKQYLVQPKYVKYQWTESMIGRGMDNHCPNDALKPSLLTSGWSGTAYKEEDVFGDTHGGYHRYDEWGDDYIWLPSLAETGFNGSQNPLWGMTVTQCGYSVGTTWSWVRSGLFTYLNNALVLKDSGVHGSSAVDATYGVRPAIHLNLTAAVLGKGGVTATPESGYDYLYREDKADQNSSTRKMYSDIKLRHMSKKEEENNFERFVLGNIEPNTNIDKFLNNLRNDRKFIKIYANENSQTPIYDGLDGDETTNANALTQFVTTGCRVELWGEDKQDKENPGNIIKLDTVYLSILGDLTGDGMVNAMDVSALTKVLQEGSLSSLPLEEQLAVYLDNKGEVGDIDIELLKNMATGKISNKEVFENTTSSEVIGYKYLSLDNSNGVIMRRNSTSPNANGKKVLGNISEKTTIVEFIANVKTMADMASAKINLYMPSGNGAILMYSDANPGAVGDIDQTNKFKNPVATGWYFTINGAETEQDRIYLSVLGDVTGDGFVNAMDVTYLNRLAANKNEVNDLIAANEIEVVLAALLTNKGQVTTADGKLLWQAVCGNVDLGQYA